MKSKILILALATLFASTGPFSTARSSAPKVKVERIAQIDRSNPLLKVSPDGESVAYVARQGSRLAVAINGKPGPLLDQVVSLSHAFTFSPDGKRHAYVGTKSGKNHLYIDGKPVAEVPLGWGRWTNQASEFQFSFSADGKRYAANLGTLLIVDGKPSPPYKGRLEHFNFSADGRHYGYVADGQAFADGKAISPPGDQSSGAVGPIHFTAKSGRYVYLWRGRKKSQTVRLVVGDKKGPEFEGNGSGVVVSEAGDHTAYLLTSRNQGTKGTHRYIIDLRPDKEFANVGNDFQFNKDGTRWAYTAKTEGGYVLVANGKAVSMEYQYVMSPRFGPDQKTVFAVASHAGKHFLLVDDKEFGPFNGIGNTVGGRPGIDEIAFSPDEKHYAFTEKRDPRSRATRLVVDGKPEGESMTTTPRYMADGRLTYIVPSESHGDQWLVVGGKREEFSGGNVMFSPDAKHYAYVTYQPGGHFYVVDGKKLAHSTTTNPGMVAAFSLDGKHFAHAWPAADRKGTQLYLDGQPVGPKFASVLTSASRAGETSHCLRFDAEGNLVVLTRQSEDVIDRITVTP